MSDLKPCPFCGGEKIKQYGGVYSQESPVTTCQSCFTQVIGHKNWNNRPAENKLKADAVRDCVEWLGDRLSAVDLSDTAVMYIEEYADKLERGE